MKTEILNDIKNFNKQALKDKSIKKSIFLKSPKSDLIFNYRLLALRHCKNDFLNSITEDSKNIYKSIYDISTIDLETKEYLKSLIPEIYSYYLNNGCLQSIDNQKIKSFIKNIENYEYLEIIDFIEKLFNVKYVLLNVNEKIIKRFIDINYYKTNLNNIKLCINPINEIYYSTSKNYILFIPCLSI